MTRVAIRSDTGDLAHALGSEDAIVGPESDADVIVIDARDGVLRRARTDVPRVLVMPGPRRDEALQGWWFSEMDRVCVETRADAFVGRTSQLPEAIRWVTDEDRASRRCGRPRLVCLASLAMPLGATVTLPEAGAIVLGRSMDAELRVASGSVARRHVEVSCEGGLIRIRDLGSTNGTLVVPRDGVARLLAPTDFGRERTSPPWFVRDRSGKAISLAPGDEIVLPACARFRLDGGDERSVSVQRSWRS